MVMRACNPSYSGGWGMRMAWTQEADTAVSRDGGIALEPGWQSKTLAPKKQKNEGKDGEKGRETSSPRVGLRADLEPGYQDTSCMEWAQKSVWAHWEETPKRHLLGGVSVHQKILSGLGVDHGLDIFLELMLEPDGLREFFILSSMVKYHCRDFVQSVFLFELTYVQSTWASS